MPKLLAEMRQELMNHPLRREFVLLKRIWTYHFGGSELIYYYDDHPDLDGQMRILENLDLVEFLKDNPRRYVMQENLAQYLTEETLNASAVNPSRISSKAPTKDEAAIASLARKRCAVVDPILNAKGWTRGKWVTEAGVGKNSVYDYLSGERNLTKENRQAMADALDLSIEELPE